MAEDPAPDRGRGEDPAGGPAPGFAAGGPLDTALPGAALTQDLDQASGPVRSCAGASDDEAFGILGGWEATEAWSAAAKLGVIRELTRRRTEPGPDGRLSSACVDGLVLEISNQLSISKRAAGGLIDLAADLEARLVLTGKALATGVISLAKVRIIAEATAALDDAAAAEALAANQHIQDRALAYKAAGMPGTMDQLRVRAFLDALNGAPAPAPAPVGPTDPDATDPDATDPAGNGGPGTGAEVAANIMLTVPLTTLLGLAGPRPGPADGRGRRPQPPQYLVHHRHRRAGTRHRARLRQAPPGEAKTQPDQAKTRPHQPSRQPRRPRPHPQRHPRPRRRLRHLAPDERWPRLHRPTPPHPGDQLRSPVRISRVPTRPSAPPPRRGPRRAVHSAHLRPLRPAL